MCSAGERAPGAADQIEDRSVAFRQPGQAGQVGLGDVARPVEIAVRALGEADDAERRVAA